MTVEGTSDGNSTKEFDDAFAAAAADGGDATPAPAAPAPAEAAPAEPAPVDPAGAEPVVAEPAAAEPATPDPAAVTPPAPDPAPAPAAPAASADEIVAGLADLLKNQPAAPAAPAAAEPAAADEAPLYTPEEVTLLTDYEKNWPDVAQAEGLKRRAEYHDLMKFVFGEVAKYTQPLFEQMRTVGNTLHMGELKQAVPDYSEDLETEVANWVETQPTYLQAGMKQVMQQGTSEEVADLIGRYRAATGAVSAPAAPAAPVPAAPAKPAITELSSAAIQAAESLAPVSGDRSQVPAGEDPADYKTAFDRYAAEMT